MLSGRYQESFDEMAKYDLPAMINYVTNVTGQQDLYYVGHSQGTMVGFIEFGRNADLAKKVKTFYALAPVATVTYMGGLLKYLSELGPELQILFKVFGVHEFLPSDFFMKWFAQKFCVEPGLEVVCSNVLFLIAGNDKKHLNETRLPVYMSHTPAGTSVRNVMHFAQLHNAKKFQMYDYGTADKNKKHYGQPCDLKTGLCCQGECRLWFGTGRLGGRWLNSVGKHGCRRRRFLNNQLTQMIEYNGYPSEHWDEMAEFDLPAMLNFVLKKTNQPYLYYAAHSQGTMMAFAHLSHNKELTSKVKAVFAMGPVATVGYITSPIRYLAEFMPIYKEFFTIFGIHDFLPNDEIMKILADLFCAPKATRDVCADVIFLIDGFDEKQLNKSVLSKKFQKYDYGREGNRQHYGQDTAPLYNLSTYNVPTALFSGGDDWLADPKDVELLNGAIHKIVFHSKSIAAWQHLDFVWGLDAAALVYKDIIQHIKKMEGMF
ncbi:hypothetical protein QZH41_007892 [Actinostola sp. cb2023]|nr:hypothetical protein QZH41_007892 [Actinostola sp. cb2023]